jgi:hypothetical protein
MPEPVPTVYTNDGPPTHEEHRLVPVQLPADVADELTLVTVWLSLQLCHRLPVATLRRALILGGLSQPRRVLTQLQAMLGQQRSTAG